VNGGDLGHFGLLIAVAGGEQSVRGGEIYVKRRADVNKRQVAKTDSG